MIEKKEVALLGEEIAWEFLKKNGYRIIEKNYRSKFGEIDIIARDKKTLCFVEVKTRQKNIKGSPEESVNLKKQKVISKSALDYLKKNNLTSKPARFDVVSINLSDFGSESIRLIKDAFSLDTKYLY